MNNHTQKSSIIINKTETVLLEAFMQDDTEALIDDTAFDTQRWQRYIEQEIGFILPTVQRKWLLNAVSQTALSYGLTVIQLWHQLPHNDELRQQLLDKVLIHESRFFRHVPSIEFVTNDALQHQRRQLVDIESGADEMFRIWSVGCASGQETWSLAMSLASKQLSNYAILGTDVSQQAVTTARLGQYDNRQQSLIPLRCQQFVQPLKPANATKEAGFNTASIEKNKVSSSCADWRIAPMLKPHVRFALHNIMDKKLPTPHLQQVIVCQNMLLYFRKFDQRDILARLSEQCALGGYIILAPGEALFWRPSNMRRIAHPQINAWQKISA